MGSLNGDHPDLFLRTAQGDRIISSYNTSVNNFFLDFGSSTMQAYTAEAVIHDLVDQPWTAHGVFSDHCFSAIGGLHPGSPVEYDTDAKWGAAMNSMLNHMGGALAAAGQGCGANRGPSRTDSGHQNWLDLDQQATPPTFALEEAAIAVKYGTTSDVQFFPEATWKRQVDLMGQIHNYQTWYLSHTDIPRDGSGVDNYGKTAGFWDVFWYALGSYLIGKNEVDHNSFFGFSESYNRPTWYDELDALDLGPAVDTYEVFQHDGHNVFMREFEKGYVYVNPTRLPESDAAATAFSLPQPGKQITHDNLAQDPKTLADKTALVVTAHRAAIVYKSAALDH